ncbi:MAG TPA: SAM-dependent chlorinase/fluorinase [Bryobacteraceae bacterium]|nr:SAM-dependent chlorinase/fluorinase [Bryobacteraceae bacterium]
MFITLTTDFGASDHFVGAMKGAILSIAPRAVLVDITHQIEPYNVNEAAFVVAQAWRYFPKRTIHVIVVDPGVGSARRPILAQSGGHFFIAPDNGVLSMVYDSGPHQVRVISNPKLMRKIVSRTFHGRDVFAPAAAHLARGTPPAKFGGIIRDYVRSSLKPRQLSASAWAGTILKVDRFGNLITNLHIDNFPEARTRPLELRVGVERIHRFALTFSDAAIGELFVIVGSSGYLEIAANQAPAARLTGCGPGAPVELRLL